MALAWNETDLPFHSTMFARRNLSRSGGLTITGIEQVVQSVSDFWEATVSFKIRNSRQILAYRALQAQNWGRAGEWIIPACPHPGLPEGDFNRDWGSDFSGVVAGVVANVFVHTAAAIGVRSLVLDMGFAPLPGSFFSIGDRLYMIGTVTPVITLSRYTVTFAPALRAAVAAGAAVDFLNPKCLMRLAQDNVGQMTLEQFRFADISLSFLEVPV